MTKAKFTVLCTVFIMAFAAASVYAAASCCDPANNSGQSVQSLPISQTSRPAALPVQAIANAPRPQPALVNSMGSGWNVPQNQGYATPARTVNAPSAPNCCSSANNPAPQQIQKPVAGCGCRASGTGYQGNQSGLTQGPVRQAAGPYALPADYRYANQKNPVFTGTAARPIGLGTLW
jgi:hypothetical protein